MKATFLVTGIFFLQTIYAQSYQTIHARAIVVDTHNDILMKYADDGFAFDTNLKGKTHSDLTRWKQGGLDVQVFSVFCDGEKQHPFNYANRQMDSLDALLERNPDKIVKVANSVALLKAVKKHKIAAMAGVEGGHMIEDDLSKLEMLYNRGARYMTLTWNNSTSWASSAFDETFSKTLTHKGLTDFGKQVVQRMNQLGMMVDISHAGEQTFWDVIHTTTKPVIASHSSVYNLCHHQRNLKDDQIKAIAQNGGVIQVNFNPGFIDSGFAKKETEFFQRHNAEKDSLTKTGMDGWHVEDFLYTRYKGEAEAMRPPLSLLIEHIEYIIHLAGIDYVGLGSDFDGITITPQQLDDVTSYPLITKALVDKGYTSQDITKILGGNFLRVLKANEKNSN